MSFNWCHGPNCHTKELQSRVRGSKGNKILRTMRVKYTPPPEPEANRYYWFKHWTNYFCNQSCLMEFVEKHIQGMLAIAPRKQALETPIKDPVKETHGNDYHSWNNWTIEKRN